jgi:hypothetical protein
VSGTQAAATGGGTDWTTALALLSLALSIVSLGWQVVSWRFGRPLVKLNAGDYMITGETGEKALIRVANSGGMPITITSAGFRQGRRPKKGRGAWVTMPDPIGTQLPHRLEPGAEALIVGSRTSLLAELEEHGVTRVRPWVALATGKTKVGGRYEPKSGDR